MKSYNFYVIVAITLLLGACSPRLSYFNQDLVDEYRWSDDELKQIQFYLSEDIVLTRQAIRGESAIISGDIKIVDGKEVEQVIFRKGTPGVLLFRPKSDRFAISFEEDGTDKFLMFGPNPKVGDRYVVLASEWKNRQGVITYNDQKYKVDARAAIAGLMVDLKKSRKVAVSSRTAKGRRID